MTGWWIDEGKLLGSRCPTVEYLAKLHGDGFRTVISLLGDEEQADAYDREAVERIGLNIRRIPILDYGTPTLRDFRGICQNSGRQWREGPDPGLTMPTPRYEMGRLLALQTATIALEP